MTALVLAANQAICLMYILTIWVRTDWKFLLRFKGNRVKVVTAQPINGQKNFKGTLLEISEDMVRLSIDDRTVAIPYQEITKAHLSD